MHSPGLEHNLPGDQSADVSLPATYRAQPQRRFPVLYFLHGYSDSTPRHEAAQMFAIAMERDIAVGAAQPMIIVLPRASTNTMAPFPPTQPAPAIRTH